MKSMRRIPKHIGIIPDGNRRWATSQGLGKEDGYQYGLDPGVELYQMCYDLGVEELTFYGFTVDNTKRPSVQTRAFQSACVDAVERIAQKDADILVLGNTKSSLFPKTLLPYTERKKCGNGNMKVNFLVNYSWKWDLDEANHTSKDEKNRLEERLASSDISRIDLIVRWGGRFRLSGFLPVQSIYADCFIVDDCWPDFKAEHVHESLAWYQTQDVTLGG